MNQKPNQDKDTVKEKLSIEEVVGTYVKLTRAGRNLRAPCPFHKERTPSFYVSPERNSYYCFGCGEKGDIFSFVEKMEGVDFRTSLKMLADRAGITLSAWKGESGPSRDERTRLYELHEDATSIFEANLAQRADVVEYLLTRGLTKETISEWRLGYAEPQWRALTDALRAKKYSDRELTESGVSILAEKQGAQTIYDRFRGRIMFPIGGTDGRIIGFSGRFFEKMKGSKETEEPAKYLNSPETPLFHKSHVLYGFDRAKGPMRRSNFAILVEGQMDLLMMHQVGLPTALASSGTAFTPEHLRSIGNITKRLVLALDGDTAGIRSALKSAMLAYQAGFDLRVASFPKGSDPADVGKDNPEELKRAVREAKTAIEFFLEQLRFESKDERGFRRAVEEMIIPLIASMQSNIDQAHFAEITSASTSLPVESIRAEVARFLQSKKVPLREDTGKAPLPTIPQIPKMTLIAGLILVGADEEAKSSMKEVLGEKRVAEIAELVEKERDRILFTLEQEEGVVHDPKELLSELRRERLLEEIEDERSTGRTCKQAGDEKGEAESSQRLQALTRKLHGFESKK